MINCHHRCLSLSLMILSVSKARDLGVIVQDDLGMKTHINNMCKSAAMGLHRIGKIRHFLDRSTTEKLVHAFIFSHFYTTIKNEDVCICVCVYVCHVYAGHLPIDGSASYFKQS